MNVKRLPICRSVSQVRSTVEEAGAGRVVLAAGFFDPVHVGHIRYLRAAKACGDFLVVAVADDGSARAVKGPGRPITPAQNRARVVAAMEMVDAVLVFSTRNIEQLLRKLRPAYFAVGSNDSSPIQHNLQTELGIKVVVVGGPKTHASNDVISRIRQADTGGKAKKT